MSFKLRSNSRPAPIPPGWHVFMSKDVFITRTASFLPLAPVGNEEMEGLLGMTGSRPSRARRITLKNNGIKSRHYVIDPATGAVRYTNAQLTAEAVRRLAGDGFALDDMACLCTGTSIADQLLPNHGVMVHGELGGHAGEHPNAVATGSEVASLVFRSTRYAAETDQQVNDLGERPELAFEKDFLRWMLSDAAGALLLQDQPHPASPSLRIDWMDILSYAHEMPVCMYAGAKKHADGTLTSWMQFSHENLGRESILAVRHDVKLLNAKIAEYCLEKPLARIASRRHLRPAEIDWFLPHMSSEYFRQPIARGLEKIGLAIPPERWFTNLETRGNTGSASMYVMLDELVRSGRLRRGERVLCFVPESGRFTSAFLHLTVV